MASANGGLSTLQLEHIRGALAGGRKPKVVFTAAAGQVAGQVGQVVELTDPSVSEEWVVVRFGRDELPFSPTDLALPVKSTPARRGGRDGVRPAEQPTPTVTPPAPGRAAAAAAREESSVPRSSSAPPGPPPSTVDPSGAGVPAEPGAGPPAKAASAARKGARPKPAAALTVTLAYADGEWTVAAQQGSKALARPYVIKPSEALKMVSLLDVPGVHEAVEEILAAARAEAQAAAERLRVQLAEVEARLAELGDGG